MENTLLGAGVACIIAAIVGGGLKAFGLEIPVIASTRRQAFLGALGLVLIAFSVWRPEPSTADTQSVVRHDLPDLSTGTWTLRNAVDQTRNDWSNSTLKFTSQAETPGGLSLRGTFAWRRFNELMGYEDFTGKYLIQNRQVILEGVSVTGRRLAVGSYSAILSSDERELRDGRWGSTMGDDPGSAGRWEATR